MNKKILCGVGTRPEAIKMAPVILALKKQVWAEVHVLTTAQHREMLDQVFSIFNIYEMYDFSAPPSCRKPYVRDRNYKVATMTWFFWPASLIFICYLMLKSKMNYPIKLLLGSLSMWLVFYLLSLLLFNFLNGFIDSNFWTYIIIIPIGMLLSPFCSALLMPEHQ